MKQSKSRRRVNGWIEEHTNPDAESQRESVAINQNGMVEIKQSKNRIRSNGLIIKHMNWEAESQRESAMKDQKGMVELKRKERKKTKGGARRLVNSMFGNGSIVKNLISKRFNCPNVDEQFDAGNQNDHGRHQKPVEINRRNVEE